MKQISLISYIYISSTLMISSSKASRSHKCHINCVSHTTAIGYFHPEAPWIFFSNEFNELLMPIIIPGININCENYLPYPESWGYPVQYGIRWRCKWAGWKFAIFCGLRWTRTQWFILPNSAPDPPVARARTPYHLVITPRLVRALLFYRFQRVKVFLFSCGMRVRR